MSSHIKTILLVAGASLALAACGTNSTNGDEAANQQTENQANNDTSGPPVDESAEYLDDDSARQWERAGKWYTDDYIKLDATIAEYINDVGFDGEPRPALGISVPHAGLRASGHIAAEVYARIEVPDTVVLLTPKHHTEGESPAVWNDGPFLVPGHALQIRHDLVADFQERLAEEVPADRAAFEEPENHPMEMQLPFLSHLNPDVQLVPITMYDRRLVHFKDFPVERIEEWGKALADFLRAREEAGEDVLVVTSTDLIHHLPLSLSDEQDPKLLDYMVRLDVEGLHDYVTSEEVTICGEIPTAILMAAAKELGHTEGELIARDTSYHLTENEDKVVGYGGVAYWR